MSPGLSLRESAEPSIEAVRFGVPVHPMVLCGLCRTSESNGGNYSPEAREKTDLHEPMDHRPIRREEFQRKNSQKETDNGLQQPKIAVLT